MSNWGYGLVHEILKNKSKHVLLNWSRKFKSKELPLTNWDNSKPLQGSFLRRTPKVWLESSVSYTDKFPAAQWVEHLTAPCCGPWSGFNPWRGETCHFCTFLFFIFLIISFSFLITRLWRLFSFDTHIIYHQIDYILLLKMSNWGGTPEQKLPMYWNRKGNPQLK